MKYPHKPYNWEWADTKSYPKGTEDNYWWYEFNKQAETHKSFLELFQYAPV